MVKTVHSSFIRGLSGHAVRIEVDISPGLPSFSVVGLGDASVQESRERVRTAIRNSGLTFPAKRVTVNLAPAEIRKTGPGFDLGTALGIVADECGLTEKHFEGIAVLGELALDGSVRSVAGMVAHAASLVERGFSDILLPMEDVEKAARIPGIRAFGSQNLLTAAQCLRNRADGTDIGASAQSARIAHGSPSGSSDLSWIPDFASVKGQSGAKRALEIAAAWGHNVLLEGAPGSGKTLLCRCFPGILPFTSDEELLTLAKIRSVSGSPSEDALFSPVRPFVPVHPQSSLASLLGWGPHAKPGLVTMAHSGTLFLDEFREFPGFLVDGLRQPMEDGEIQVSRAGGSYCYPSRFQLVAATNPCPCGYLGDRERPCSCAVGQVERYRAKISGPVLDRIDLRVGVPRLSGTEIASCEKSERSAEILARVLSARDRQRERFGTYSKTNASMTWSDLENLARIGKEAERYAVECTDRLQLTGRSYDRLRKVARTIADLEGNGDVEVRHIAEAVGFRQR